MKNLARNFDPTSRRSFVTGAAKSLLGLGTMAFAPNIAFGNDKETILSGGGKAKRVIYLYMAGGMSHLDTFDTKPGAATQGTVESNKTSSPGI